MSDVQSEVTRTKSRDSVSSLTVGTENLEYKGFFYLLSDHR